MSKNLANDLREQCVTGEQLSEWEQLALDQKRSKLIGYEWAEKTRPILNATIRLVASVRSLRSRLAALERQHAASQEKAGGHIRAEHQRDAALAALGKYGTHLPECDIAAEDWRCTCGLGLALSGELPGFETEGAK